MAHDLSLTRANLSTPGSAGINDSHNNSPKLA
jgi:hypothetical protein